MLMHLHTMLCSACKAWIVSPRDNACLLDYGLGNSWPFIRGQRLDVRLINLLALCRHLRVRLLNCGCSCMQGCVVIVTCYCRTLLNEAPVIDAGNPGPPHCGSPASIQ